MLHNTVVMISNLPGHWSFSHHETQKKTSWPRHARVQQIHPLFCNVTWKAGGSTRYTSLDIASHMQHTYGIDVVFHVAAVNMTRTDMYMFLQDCKQCGIRNILALHGDAIEGGGVTEFANALDLVTFIRSEFNDEFRIGVTAYPECHVRYPNSYVENIMYVKRKIDAGADYVITQVFFDVFDAGRFLQFKQDCVDMGIRCPIIPGVMPITSYRGLRRITQLCNVFVPEEVLEYVRERAHDEKMVTAYGTTHAVEMCKELWRRGINHIHLYTMNHVDNILDIVHSFEGR